MDTVTTFASHECFASSGNGWMKAHTGNSASAVAPFKLTNLNKVGNPHIAKLHCTLHSSTTRISLCASDGAPHGSTQARTHSLEHAPIRLAATLSTEHFCSRTGTPPPCVGTSRFLDTSQYGRRYPEDGDPYDSEQCQRGLQDGAFYARLRARVSGSYAAGSRGYDRRGPAHHYRRRICAQDGPLAKIPPGRLYGHPAHGRPRCHGRGHCVSTPKLRQSGSRRARRRAWG